MRKEKWRLLLLWRETGVQEGSLAAGCWGSGSTLDRVEQPGKACAGISAELGWWGVVVGCSRSSAQNQEDMERAERGEECLES